MAPWIEVAASAVYGFDLKETGISVEGGKSLAPGHFLGLEGTYFHPEETDTFAGQPVNSREHLSTILVLYRYSHALPGLADLSLYAGGGAGVGIVRLSSDFPVLKLTVADRSNSFAYEAQAGVKWMLNHRWSAKVGYRYFQIDRVELFGQRQSIHDNLAEAGLTFRF